jgi:hypothetical protein
MASVSTNIVEGHGDPLIFDYLITDKARQNADALATGREIYDSFAKV